MRLGRAVQLLLVVVHVSLVAFAESDSVDGDSTTATSNSAIVIDSKDALVLTVVIHSPKEASEVMSDAENVGAASLAADSQVEIGQEANGVQAQNGGDSTANSSLRFVPDSNQVVVRASTNFKLDQESDIVAADAEKASSPLLSQETNGRSNFVADTNQVTISTPTDVQEYTIANEADPDRLNNTEAHSTTASHVQLVIRAGREKSRGVNLGGWLVAEHWMTKDSEVWWGLSDDDANRGEYVAMTKSPRELAIQRFKAHRDRFITERDIREIARARLNTVRVSVGYWIVGFDNHDPSNKKAWQVYASGGLDYLDRLIRDWAKKYNVAVLISMHAAKGSQNGADHSAPEVGGQSNWSAYPENVASTLEAVRFLASRYKDDTAFLGIGLLNEPAGSTSTKELYQYYEDAYRAIRIEDKNDCVLTIAPLLWEQNPDHMSEVLPMASNVWVEWHRYFAWGYEDTSENDLLTKSIPAFKADAERWHTKSDKKLFIGEFSFATSGSQFNDKNNTSRLREYAQAQMDVLKSSAVDGGWTFWTWRIDGDDATEGEVSRWSLRNMIKNGIFPALS